MSKEQWLKLVVDSPNARTQTYKILSQYYTEYLKCKACIIVWSLGLLTRFSTYTATSAVGVSLHQDEHTGHSQDERDVVGHFEWWQSSPEKRKSKSLEKHVGDSYFLHQLFIYVCQFFEAVSSSQLSASFSFKVLDRIFILSHSR